MTAYHATATTGRRLRDGRQIVHVDQCPHCGHDHWLTAERTLAYAPCGPNRPVLLDGLGLAR